MSLLSLDTDSCHVNNGGCGPHASCSQDPSTYAVKCTCQTGYTNTGSDSAVNCTGIVLRKNKFPSTYMSTHTLPEIASGLISRENRVQARQFCASCLHR